jgi:hypothetical protein
MVAYIAMEVVAKDGYERNDSSVASKVSNIGIPPRSGVTDLDASSAGPNAESTGDTCTVEVAAERDDNGKEERQRVGE